jgi:hypothetical protein
MENEGLSLTAIPAREDIPRLLNARQLFGAGVEVGVQTGDYSQTLLREWRGSKLYLVDLWRPLPNSSDPANVPIAQHRDNFLKIFDVVAPFDSRAVIIREDSLSAARLFQDSSLDFVYLDAGHSHAEVEADINAWSAKVRPGGLLMGHDYMDGEVSVVNGANEVISTFRIEVQRAVNEWASRHRKEIYVTHERMFRSWIVEM